MGEGLDDEEKSFIGPLLVVGLIVVLVLLLSVFFLHTGKNWSF